MTETSVRRRQEWLHAEDLSSEDHTIQCRIGWYDQFCRDDVLTGQLQKLSKVVMGVTGPYILDHYYVRFKGNHPLSGPLYDGIRFEPLYNDRNGRCSVVIRDSPYKAHKWILYIERHGSEQSRFACGSVRDMLRHINSIAPES